jgi:SAM-dependent methyltransferase
MNQQSSIFAQIHGGLPRESPGESEATRRAFASMAQLPERPRILDIGCGPGKQTLDLAGLRNASIVGLDLSSAFLLLFKQRSNRLASRNEWPAFKAQWVLFLSDHQASTSGRKVPSTSWHSSRAQAVAPVVEAKGIHGDNRLMLAKERGPGICAA